MTLNESVVTQIKPKPKPKKKNLADFAPHDVGNAEAVFSLYGDRIAFTDELGWLFYNGKCWNSKGARAALNKAVVKVLHDRSLEAYQNGKDAVSKVSRLQNSVIQNCISRLEHLAWDNLDNYDASPELLNCNNGVINLRTGELLSHSPSQKFTYCIGIDYDPNADDTEWQNFVYNSVKPSEIDDTDKRAGEYSQLTAWLQAAVGYSLTGCTNEQCCFYLEGPPRAGKGVFLQMITSLLGYPLSSGVDFDTFVQKRGGNSQNFDLAPLKPCRMITASETDNVGQLNAKTLKSATGNDMIYCSHKHREFFSYIPQFKIWISSNFPVNGDADDDGLWSRLRIIEFPNSYIGREDFSLSERLSANKQGVLKWSVEGAIEWFRRKDANIGLGHPDIISEAVSATRYKNDTVQQWIDENCVTDSSFFAYGPTLKSDYKDWCQENGFMPLGGKRFGLSMRHKGFEYGTQRISKTETQKCWTGLMLVSGLSKEKTESQKVNPLPTSGNKFLDEFMAQQ